MTNSNTNVLWTSDELKEQTKDCFVSLENEFACWSAHETDTFRENINRHHPGIILASSGILETDGVAWRDLLADENTRDFLQVIVFGEISSAAAKSIPEQSIFSYIPHNAQFDFILRTIRNASLLLKNKIDSRELLSILDNRTNELEELNKIGIALSAERDSDKLLSLILQKSREITKADAGTLYLVEGITHGKAASTAELENKQLRFKLSQCDSVELGFREYLMPIARKSIAGYVTLTGKLLNIPDAYDLAPDSEFTLNRSFDESVGYRTKSVLVIPMKTHKDEIIGVLQLINRKRNWQTKLSNSQVVQENVIAFDAHCENLANSLASQAAVSIENNRLYQEIKNLFDGFVLASVHAIEQRDPTTSGHSLRVAQMSLKLAECINHINAGPYKNIRFSENALQQIRYAALLHDFGKIGVRENVLVKANKLYPHELDAIIARFNYIKRGLELKYSRKQVDELLHRNREDALRKLPELEGNLKQSVSELDEYLQIVLKANEPSILEQAAYKMLQQIANKKFDGQSEATRLITKSEASLLSIPKGSLSENERKQIEAHVSDTYNFLIKIPWTTELRAIPDIAHAHHEKLDGSGYPLRLEEKDIPIEARIMAIADIYDALTAADRPYKKAVPVEKALKILEYEMNSGKIDPELFRIFVESEVFKIVNQP
ncbi:GAF domain-containing protein [candidate division KSB1 bacterium]|nr:GAF domain-containing protein [candidate division KSB1 bacterium]